MRRSMWWSLVLGGTLLFGPGCSDTDDDDSSDGPDESPTLEPGPTETDEPGDTDTPATATETPVTTPSGESPSPDASPSDTPEASATPVATGTPSDASPTPGSTPEDTLEPSPTGTPDDSPGPSSPTPGDAPTPTAEPTATAAPTPTAVPDRDGDGYTIPDGDCDDDDPSSHPGAGEVPYDGVDQDCLDGDLVDVDQDGYTAGEAGGSDCDDQDPNTYPGAPEFEDDKDNDCDGRIDEDLNTNDDDGDGAAESEGDCDDNDPTSYPGGLETPYDGVDQDCSGADLVDVDGDGYVAAEVSGDDCDDGDASIHPGASEVCDGVDQDCDGSVDDGVTSTWYRDADGDGYGDPAKSVQACAAPSGYVATAGDCRDNNDDINPAATERCNGIDDDCDASIDEDVTSTFYRDADGDGYGNPSSTTQACAAPSGYSANRTDCDDTDASIHPGAVETCNGKDDDCDKVVDDGVTSTWYRDADGDGYGDARSTTQACTAPSGYVADNTDCDDTAASIHPGAAEACNGKDDDCDSSIDEGVRSTWYLDADGDGYGNAGVTTEACSAPSHYVADNTDCNDLAATAYPGATEVCDGLDNDCDAQVDEGAGKTTFYRDADSDGYGNAAVTSVACTAPSGYVGDGTDCDDSSAQTYPGAAELCDAKDNDCDGNVDDGVLGASASCPAVSCEAIRKAGYTKDKTFYYIKPGGASSPLEAYCDMTSYTSAITLYTTQSKLAQLNSTSILSTCPTGWTAYRYVAVPHVNVATTFTALMVSTSRSTATYYLSNSFAGPEPNCNTTQNLSGYLNTSGQWVNDGINLNATYGGFMKDNCNLNIFDPIPLDYRKGPSTTTGTTVLYNSQETGETFPVMCTVP